MVDKVLVWRCPLCMDVLISKNWERHTMDSCKCGKTKVDYEEFYTRYIGKPDVVSELSIELSN